MLHALILSLSLLAVSTAVQAKIGDFWREKDGTLVLASHFYAEKYCIDQGTRLPTFREFAEEALSFGAQIRETQFPNISFQDSPVRAEIAVNRAEGFYEHLTRNANNDIVVEFYLNVLQYSRPNLGLRYIWLWSSSIFPSDPALAYGFGHEKGNTFVIQRENYIGLVRCLVK